MNSEYGKPEVGELQKVKQDTLGNRLIGEFRKTNIGVFPSNHDIPITSNNFSIPRPILVL